MTYYGAFLVTVSLRAGGWWPRWPAIHRGADGIALGAFGCWIGFERQAEGGVAER